jgi:hypothetical protein
MFSRNILSQSSVLKSESSKQPTRRKQLVVCLNYSSTLKMEAVIFFETSVNLYRNILLHFPEDSAFQFLLILLIFQGCRRVETVNFYPTTPLIFS